MKSCARGDFAGALRTSRAMRRRQSAGHRRQSSAVPRRGGRRSCGVAAATDRRPAEAARHVGGASERRRPVRPDPCSAARRAAAGCRGDAPAAVATTDRLPDRDSGRPGAPALVSCGPWRTRAVRDGGGAARAPRLRYRQSGARLQRESRHSVRMAGDIGVSEGTGPERVTNERMHDARCGRRQRRSAGVSTSRRMPGSSTSSRFTGALANSVRAPVSPSSAASAS